MHIFAQVLKFCHVSRKGRGERREKVRQVRAGSEGGGGRIIWESFYVMAFMEWVYMAWSGYIKSKAG